MTFQCLLSLPASSLSWISSPVKARHANSSSSHTHTKPPLSVAASNYLGEEGQGEVEHWVGRKEGGGHMHSCAGFEAETTLCRKVNTGDGRREAERARGD